jgi:hypothetical protein
MEIDSNGNEADAPRTNLKVANFTALQPQRARTTRRTTRPIAVPRQLGHHADQRPDRHAEQRVHPHERLVGQRLGAPR